MNNLLSNAIKYTDKGTVELCLRCARNDDDDERVWVTIKVKDTGKGIRAEDMDKLFKDYSKLDLVSNRTTEGTGLGLTITKSLAELMDGTVEVESEYGKGSIFTVKIAQKFVSNDQIGCEIMNSLKKFRYIDDRRGRNTHFKRICIPYARVLLVDDNLTNLEVAKGLMKPYGMKIDCVTKGQEAIDAIREEKVRYNAVFMDHMMPEMNGIEATRIIREEIGTQYAKDIPVIAFSANAIAGNEALFLSKGFQAFLSKPIEIERLDAIIRRWVRDKDQEKILFETNKKVNGQEAPMNFDRMINQDDQRRSIDISSMKINGLNICKGVERLGGDKEAYVNILRFFAVNTASLLETIEDISENKMSDYAVTVHGIKGSCRNIDADELADYAENLEKAAKAGNFKFVSARNRSFLIATQQLISEIHDTLAWAYLDKPKPGREKPDSVLLAKLFDACKRFDTDEIDALIKELDLYEYESDGGLVAELLNCSNQYNFKEIKEKLSAEFERGLI